jgi:hypothetical protein
MIRNSGMKYWHMQMKLPFGRGEESIDPSQMLHEKQPVIAVGGGSSWEDGIQCRNFKGEKDGLQIGDIVMIRDGSHPIALCKVISQAFENEKLTNKYGHIHFRYVDVIDWAKENEWEPQFKQGTLTKLKTTKTSSWKYIDNWYKCIAMNDKVNELRILLETNKNLILTGAPGTGKTYLAKQIAKQMIGVATDDELKQSEQYDFVQFHSSYDYTDFVEGLRPIEPDKNGNIGFKLEKGVFKAFCEKAINVYEEDMPVIKDEDLFDRTFGALYSKIKDAGSLELKCPRKARVDHRFKIKDDDITYIVGIQSLRRINKEYIKFMFNDFIKKRIYDLSDVTKETYYGYVEDVTKGKYKTIDYIYYSCVLQEMLNISLKIQPDKKDTIQMQTASNAPFIFIIDEINRGETSKIFGELFFSIDPSYRGEKGAVRTQYSNMHKDRNDSFYVPDDVYIIGTMNDIDRSVESFDFAMRRRFTWVEITAEESAKNMNLPEDIIDKMSKLNAKISDIEGLNASYHIGGAYFLDKDGKPETDYHKIWKFRLEPLLREYLRGMSGVEEKLRDLKSAYDSKNDG